MAAYERMTALSVRDVLKKAEEILPARLPLEKVKEGSHSVMFSGGDGTVTVEAHRHAPDTTVVHARTDRLRTSRLDLETQFFLERLPYQPGDTR